MTKFRFDREKLEGIRKVGGIMAGKVKDKGPYRVEVTDTGDPLVPGLKKIKGISGKYAKIIVEEFRVELLNHVINRRVKGENKPEL